MRHETTCPLSDNFLCGFLNNIWKDGWLDCFSNDHFLIHAINDNISNYHGKKRLEENNANLFCFKSHVGMDFSINLSNKLDHLCKVFEKEQIKKFVVDQLSAGKEHYDEDQFFRALTEVEVLHFFSNYVYSVNKKCIYEPHIGINGKNPEARFIFDNKVIVDIEVKTPGFSNNDILDKLLLPTVLINNDGRNALSKLCVNRNVKCLFPRVRKLVDFLNSAASKFERPLSSMHVNLLYINWTYSEFPSKSFLEAYSILFNDLTGLLKHKEIGLQFGVSEEAYSKISAVIVYTSSLNNLVFQDFRYLWSTKNFSIIFLNGDETLITKITQMDWHLNSTAPLVLSDFKAHSIDDQVEEAYVCTKAIELINQYRLS